MPQICSKFSEALMPKLLSRPLDSSATGKGWHVLKPHSTVIQAVLKIRWIPRSDETRSLTCPTASKNAARTTAAGTLRLRAGSLSNHPRSPALDELRARKQFKRNKCLKIVIVPFVTSSFLLLAVMPGATSSVLAPNSDALVTSSNGFSRTVHKMTTTNCCGERQEANRHSSLRCHTLRAPCTSW